MSQFAVLQPIWHKLGRQLSRLGESWIGVRLAAVFNCCLSGVPKAWKEAGELASSGDRHSSRLGCALSAITSSRGWHELRGGGDAAEPLRLQHRRCRRSSVAALSASRAAPSTQPPTGARQLPAGSPHLLPDTSGTVHAAQLAGAALLLAPLSFTLLCATTLVPQLPLCSRGTAAGGLGGLPGECLTGCS